MKTLLRYALEDVGRVFYNIESGGYIPIPRRKDIVFINDTEYKVTNVYFCYDSYNKDETMIDVDLKEITE